MYDILEVIDNHPRPSLHGAVMTSRLISTIATPIPLASCADQTRSESIMDDIETRIEMPEGALPIDQYTRSYFENGDVIEAIYVDSDLAPPKGRYWNPKKIVSMEDGGCSQISVTYDPATEEITAHCNGHR